MVLHRPRLVVGLPFLACVLVGSIGLIRHPSFSSSAQFVPQATDMAASRMAGLAAQFGVTVPGADRSQSPDAYAAMIVSRSSLGALVDSTYHFTEDGHTFSGNLVSLYETSGNNVEDRRERAIKDLAKDVAVDIGLKSGVINVRVRSRWAPLAQQLCQHILDYVNARNLSSRQARARAEELFYQERLSQAASELRAAEDELEGFSARNRNGTATSPRLSREEERLRRLIVMRQQVYTSLMQARDQASMDAVHNTPVISILDRPNLPYRADSRLLVLKVAAAALAALVLACAIGLGLDALDRKKQEDPALFAHIADMRRDAFARLLGRRRAHA
ncbi:MAG: hypothetical protein ABIX19_12970 [Gemmatimonadaceae bacterium]